MQGQTIVLKRKMNQTVGLDEENGSKTAKGTLQLESVLRIAASPKDPVSTAFG